MEEAGTPIAVADQRVTLTLRLFEITTPLIEPE